MCDIIVKITLRSFVCLFWTVLQVFTICSTQRTYHCDSNNEYANYISCLNKWRVIRESSRGHSIFLKDVALIDEICILPGSPNVEEMDKCVIEAVSPFCESILTHWKGVRQFVSYLCERREEFEGKHARCRMNSGFQSEYERCTAKHVQEMNSGKDNCRSYRELQRCLKHALRRHCSERATEFFSLAFSARDAPLLAYSCKQDSHIVSDYVFDIQRDNGRKTKRQGSNEQHTNTDQPASGYKAEEIAGHNLEVAPPNKSNAVFFSSVLILFVLLLRIV